MNITQQEMEVLEQNVAEVLIGTDDSEDCRRSLFCHKGTRRSRERTVKL